MSAQATPLPQSQHDPMVKLEYVVESRHGNDLDVWYVTTADQAVAEHFAALGVPVTSGCRVVLDARSMQPVGVLEAEPPPAPLPAGYNPYFDLPAV